MVFSYNEIEGMRAVMPQIDPTWVDQILVVDGGSTDGTIEYARESGYEVLIQKNPGLRNAYREAYPRIEGEIVIFFSPDGNSVASDIPRLVKKMKEGHDMVILSRYLPGARSEDDTAITRLGNKVFTGLINLLFGGSYTDAMIMYRAIRRELFEELGIFEDRIVERIFGHMICIIPLLSMRAAKARKRIAEIPGDEPARVGGEGKCRHFTWGAIYLLEMLQEVIQWKIPRPPSLSAE
ncbi:MAG: glycosyltransferase [Candidatus Hydrogenedentota bacterium]|nr:MAG: glycosyltransferase [Candidatus Hydrogenedentota bacterium]